MTARTSPRTTVLATAGLVALVVAMAAVSGCARTQSKSKVMDTWPKAVAERTIARPLASPRWPLTGLPAPDESAIQRRVISVKIENSPAARPQTGLSSADVVYESLTEGGITRFNAIFHSNLPKTIGPVRSARLSDIQIVPQYGAVFVFSGANSQVNGRIRKTAIPNLSEDAGVTYPYFRSSQKAAPHNLFITTLKVLETAKRKGWPTAQSVRPFAFERRSIEASAPAVTEIKVPFSDANTSLWKYQRSTRTYLRWNNGKEHTDEATGKQIAARNVVVLWTKTGAGARTVHGDTLDITMNGTGRASVFHDGVRYDGTWATDGKRPPSFKAADGSLIRLGLGNTWFQVIPTSQDIRMQ